LCERPKQSLRPFCSSHWFAQFRLFHEIHQADSQYVCRLRDNSVYGVAEDRPLTQEDKDAGVISDQIVLLGEDRKGADRPNHPIRLICVTCTPHVKRANSKTKFRTGEVAREIEKERLRQTRALQKKS
jgi:hypothetical protein